MQINVNDNVTVSLKKIGKSLNVDIAKMPAQSLNHIFDYGLRQILNDAMASAKTEAEAEAGANKRLDNLMNGTLRASPAREGNPVRRRALEIAEVAITKNTAFIGWCQKAGLQVSDKDAKAKLRELANEAVSVDGNKFMAQAAVDVEAAKGLDVDLDLD